MFTYDPMTPLGQVRLLCTDRDAANPLFQDHEIQAFQALEGDNIRRAAALALETIASEEALLLKVVKRLDVQTDGAKLASELRAGAKNLRDQAAAAETRAEDAFDIAEMVTNEASAQERLFNEWTRGL